VSVTVLSVSKLSVSFGTGSAVARIVDDISFELQAGEVLGLVGESGCGKSITAAALMGLLPSPPAVITAEHILLGTQDLAQMGEPEMRRIRGREMSMVFQEPLTALDPVFTIGSQLSAVIRRHMGKSKKDARVAATEMVERVGIADAARVCNNYPHQLSGGMRQRVMIAMALACRPRVLIADEPTTALDVSTQAQVLDQLLDLGRESGTAILLITHDLGVVAQFCDRAIVMYCGRIVEESPVAELFTQAAHPYTAGLLAAVPRVSHGAVRRVTAIPGSVPDPAVLPAGCHFAERCGHANDQCRDEVPQLQATVTGQAAPAHRHACFHPLQTNWRPG
jgi:oligopeptide/dipeptide ABC transporter ATP-binding protein